MTTGIRRFTKAELDALAVPDDIVLKLTNDVHDHIPDGGRGSQSALPSPAGEGPKEGAAIAVWQMLSSGDRRGGRIPSWLHKQGISYFRGWIRPAGPVGPDFVMDWVFPLYDGAYVMHRDGDVGPYSPPPGCDLQTFVDAVARLSYQLLLDMLGRLINMLIDNGSLRGKDGRPRLKVDLTDSVVNFRR